MNDIADTNKRAELAATRRHHAEQLDADRDFHMRADAAFNVLGLGAAPRRTHGEPVHAHRARVINGALAATAALDHMSRRWLGFDPATIRDDTVAEQLAKVVLDEAVNAWTEPTGPLRESVERDSAGREVRKFYGDPECCWAPFKAQSRIVSRWGTLKGAEARGVRAGHMLPNGKFVASR